MTDLFTWTPGSPATTAEEFRKANPDADRKTPKPSGHAAPPGSGPAGETCGSCGHLARVRRARDYLKCYLMQKHWTGGGKTDVRARDRACRMWEKNE